MNIQQYFEERNNKEQEKTKGEQTTADVIPVVEEQASISKVEQETARIKIHKHVVEVEKNIDVSLLQEGYDIQHVSINQFVDQQPPIREEGDTIIIPVVREVLVVEKRLELVEELHIIKNRKTVNHTESFTLRKEEVNVERVPTNDHKA
jgi:uncharacterized protein (TIGR02271 family)